MLRARAHHTPGLPYIPLKIRMHLHLKDVYNIPVFHTAALLGTQTLNPT